MPGFIRQKAALPHREPSAPKASVSKKSAPATKKRSAQVDLTSSPAKKPTSSIDLTTPAKPASKKRPSPDTPASPSLESATNYGAKKTRTVAPLPTKSATSAAKSASSPEASIPSSLPTNGTDYIHDPSGVLPQLMESYNIATMQIISSSKMSAKIARSLDTLVLGKIDMADVRCKPGLVVMYSKAATSSKLVSTVEVIKREIGSKGQKWYQYSALSETMVVIPRKTVKDGKKGKEGDKKDEKDEMDVGGEEDEESYFETMKTRQERVLEGTDRMRATPVLTVYLSRVPIEKLKIKYGEQTNAKK